MMKKVNIKDKFQLFDAYWTPKILGEINNSHVKIFKAKGEFVWHSHKDETDGPPIVRIPWEELRGVISPSHPLCAILNETIHSQCFIASWDENSLERSLKEYDRSQVH